MLSVHSDEYFMQQALTEAKRAYDNNEVPVGAVVVCENRIIARAHNQTEILNDVTAHAEILAYTAAAEYLNHKYLNECTLFVTLEPCSMCAGAMMWSQLKRLVYGASDLKRGYQEYSDKMLHPKTEILGGVMQKECAELLENFFRAKRV
ncbi:MAG: tRNA adenosine(34) deaminase TadA [Flavobacteriales bacterium]|nr:tRNA adenosine(34) deaminase TadA [Flavobacteriales bacterium]